MNPLILLGRGPSREQCPFDAETWAPIITLSEPDWVDKSYSKLFEMDWVPEDKVEHCFGIAQEKKIPIVGINAKPKRWLNEVEPYPIWDIIREFKANYFKNIASFMLAYAIFKGYEKVRLYGFDQAEREYLVHRSYVTFWLGVAIGRGLDYRPMGESLGWIWAGGKKKLKYMVEDG